MKPPHPSEVILNGRLRARQSPISAQMLAEFGNLAPEAKAEFLFWLVQDQFAEIDGLRRQISTMTDMIKRASAA
jgi:hypothetical protein